MSLLEHPGWIIVIAVIAAACLAMIAAFRVAAGVRRLSGRLEALQASPTIADLDVLQVRMERFSELQGRAEAALARLRSAVEDVRSAFSALRSTGTTEALHGLRSDVAALVEELA